jgi:eukaryotic-like serine/threonine-protein kinase
MSKLNCWEVKKCGRQPNGNKCKELGICPASTEKKFDGTNSGKNSGRYCWRVAGTCCGGKVQGTFAEKARNCAKCEFHLFVKSEEGQSFMI